eukprot:127521_1
MQLIASSHCDRREVIFKVIVIGEWRVGKTSIVEKYVHNKFEQEYKQTIGADFFEIKEIHIDHVGGKYSITLQIWDMSGQKRFQSLVNAFYPGADACVLVYDITTPQTLVQIENLRGNFLDQQDIGERNSIPFLLLANKCDKKQNLYNVEQMILLLTGYCKKVEIRYDLKIPFGIIQIIQQMIPSDGCLYASKHKNMLFYETSAFDGTNIDIAFKTLVTKCLDHNKFSSKIVV